MRALLLCSLLLVGCGATLVDHLDLTAAPPPPGGCPQTVNACGPTCGACPAPSANGTASCDSVNNTCVFACQRGYLRCGDASCCRAAEVAAGGDSTCAVVDNRTVRCWGAPLGSNAPPSPVPALVAGLAAVNTVALGSSHACAILSSGSVRCWGDNSAGQLGHPASGPSPTPLDPVPGVSGATALSLGDRHSCASTASGVLCWGANELGQLGDGSQDPAIGVVSVAFASHTDPFGGGPHPIAAGLNHTCAVLTSGVACWGANESGQIGNGGGPAPQPTPAAVQFSGGAVGALAVGAGQRHSCALLASSTLDCWGQGTLGQLGDGSSTNQKTPRHVVLTNPTVIAAGRAHTCAAAGSGSQLFCWGANDSGQLGTGDKVSQPRPSTSATPLLDIRTLAAGTDHACALQAAGPLLCWGRNDRGQVGIDSANAPVPTPTLVSAP